MGGTMVSQAVKWARTQFEEKAKSQDRIFVLVTDADIYDFQKCTPEFEKLSAMEVETMLCVPETMVNFGNVEDLIQKANARVIPIRHWKEFAETVSELINRS